MTPALSVRHALDDLSTRTPERVHRHSTPTTTDAVAADFAVRFGGVPATSHSRSEDVALYSGVDDSAHPVLLGLYGDERRVRDWLPGLPERANPVTARQLLGAARAPILVTDPPCAQTDATAGGLGALPVLCTTPRDAGPFLTAGLLCAHVPGPDGPARDRRVGAPDAGSRRPQAHPVDGARSPAARGVRGHGLAERAVTHHDQHRRAARRDDRLGAQLPVPAPGHGQARHGRRLAGAPLTLARATSQPAAALAESEIVVEGYLDGTTADECRSGVPTVSLPEFLGYDGSARTALPVITVTAITTRKSALYQAVIGPGREQSVILGMAGALSVALSEPDRLLVRDLHLSPAGGGMLLLTISVDKRGPDCDRRLGPIARRVFTAHPFVKLIVFTDEDVDIGSPEDVLWAVTTRANLGTDTTTEEGFTPLGVDPSQSAAWAAERGPGATGRSWIDATVPFQLRHAVQRSFPSLPGGAR